MECQSKKLIDEFRSLLDESTILSISSDYNLENPKEFARARQVLLSLSKDVVAEEATGFNPSGIGADGIVDINSSNQGDDAEAGGTTSSDTKSVGGFTVTTESSVPPSLMSSGSSKNSSGGTPGLLHVDIFDGLNDGDKELQLSEMFVSLKPIDVKFALQKSKGDASLAMDELLNLQWLEETGQRPKGIDGFYVSDDDNVPNKKKKKGKRKKKVKVASLKPSAPENTSDETNNNDLEQNDHITLISDRLHLAPSEVTSIYHHHGASPGATVVEILNNYIALGLPHLNSHLISDTREVMKDFHWVPQEYVKATLEICSTRDDAIDIVRILADHFEKPAYLKYDVSYSLVASDLGEIVGEPQVINMSAQLPKSPTSPKGMRATAVNLPLRSSNQPTTLEAAAAASKSLAESRNHSFTSAAAAFRKGKSNPLFRQAGAYYADRAREQATTFRQAINVEANYLVDSKSTEDMIDLHGVTVQDGVEIALDRVQKWWQSLGEERTRKAKRGFTVVTGLGRHSSDGRSRLRINVFKALVADGWKAEVLTGSYLITGRRS
ncbi:uncharacterized protein GGS22DRAFT_154663 [Annulohypoxylon maeteangense]|uniref:uncharacterized protein n=1 Tax=Annulohypoxylon maeteangense TaxID=1927788 RepID=UPI0020082FC6|nr:uncharacterized protein GGS22DRAFT_154663 [Annulohypoxylon maeteangense]KAI0887960.1 hypothetical protein GGS22DRAFT_154663 [Annulohypoxylon maeteangense]